MRKKEKSGLYLRDFHDWKGRKGGGKFNLHPRLKESLLCNNFILKKKRI